MKRPTIVKFEDFSFDENTFVIVGISPDEPDRVIRIELTKDDLHDARVLQHSLRAWVKDVNSGS